MPIVRIDVTAGSASVEAETELVLKITTAVDKALMLISHSPHSRTAQKTLTSPPSRWPTASFLAGFQGSLSFPPTRVNRTLRS